MPELKEIFLTAECVSFRELESHIDMLHGELEEVRKKARAAYDQYKRSSR